MPIRLEFLGRDVIRRNPAQFLEALRAKYPHLSETGLHAVAGAEFEKRHPRHKRHVVHLFGRDILGDFPETLRKEDVLDAADYTRIEAIETDDGPVEREVYSPQEHRRAFERYLAGEYLTHLPAWRWITPAFRRVLVQADRSKREAMIDPKMPDALDQTYVWCHANGWTQEVTDADAAVLRRSSARSWFRDADAHGAWVPVRAWDLPIKERFEAPNLEEARRFVADRTRNPQWRGR